jgi:predicted GNAT family N-acyltransferase
VCVSSHSAPAGSTISPAHGRNSFGVRRVAAATARGSLPALVPLPHARREVLALPSLFGRAAVFVGEQGIPREEEIDEFAGVAVHCVGYGDDGAPVAAGRLVLMDGYCKIGRMAVLKAHRGVGMGAAVLDLLEREGVARGVRLFKLSAQLSARAFYDRAGYEPDGAVYDEVGIPHIAMRKRIADQR